MSIKDHMARKAGGVHFSGEHLPNYQAKAINRTIFAEMRKMLITGDMHNALSLTGDLIGVRVYNGVDPAFRKTFNILKFTRKSVDKLFYLGITLKYSAMLIDVISNYSQKNDHFALVDGNRYYIYFMHKEEGRQRCYELIAGKGSRVFKALLLGGKSSDGKTEVARVSTASMSPVNRELLKTEITQAPVKISKPKDPPKIEDAPKHESSFPILNQKGNVDLSVSQIYRKYVEDRPRIWEIPGETLLFTPGSRTTDGVDLGRLLAKVKTDAGGEWRFALDADLVLSKYPGLKDFIVTRLEERYFLSFTVSESKKLLRLSLSHEYYEQERYLCSTFDIQINPDNTIGVIEHISPKTDHGHLFG
jgi:hypothetical protein